MSTYGLLFIALVTGTLSIPRVTANPEQFPAVTYGDIPVVIPVVTYGITAHPEEFSVVTYGDIELLNATCPESDNCTEERFFDNLEVYNCNCEEFCTEYDTCCVDSDYRDKERKTRNPNNCVKVYGAKPVFMIDSCDSTWFGDNHTDDLCAASAEEKEDLFLAVPVTNHKTGITYRNYYCAVCNNETDKEQLTLWNISLQSLSKDVMSSPLPHLHFLNGEKVWIIGNETGNITNVTVNPIVKTPREIKKMVHDCVPNVISRCANDWNDTSIEDKCAAYLAIIGVNASDGYRRIYRNPHCAICNYESLNSKFCSNWGHLTSLTRAPSNTFFVRLFSLYDKENKCGDDKVYDTIAKKCRKVFNA